MKLLSQRVGGIDVHYKLLTFMDRRKIKDENPGIRPLTDTKVRSIGNNVVSGISDVLDMLDKGHLCGYLLMR